MLFAVLVLGFSNCGNNTQNQSRETQPIEDADEIVEEFEKPEEIGEIEEPELTLTLNADFLYVEDGDLFFYDVESDKATSYADEPGKVVNIVCSTEGMVYYSVIVNDKLLLKSLDLTVPDPKPELLADWNVELAKEDEEEVGYPPYGRLILNQDQNQVALVVDISWFAGPCNNLLVYDCTSKTINKLVLYHFDEEQGLMDFVEKIDFSPYYLERNFNKELFKDGDCLSYLGNDTPVCMSDPDKDKEYFSNIFEDIRPDHVPISLDPTRTRVLFSASTFLGDEEMGYYAVSSLDGKDKMVLTSPGNMDMIPCWLRDGSLLFVDYDYDAVLFLVKPDNMNPNGEVQTIAHTNKFCVLP